MRCSATMRIHGPRAALRPPGLLPVEPFSHLHPHSTSSTVAAGTRPTYPRTVNSSRTKTHVPAASAAVDSAVWPNPAPELTDLSLVEDVEEELGDRLQRYAHVSLSAGVLVLVDQCVKWAMQTLGLQFPHTLTGMLIVVATTISAKAAGGAAAAAVDQVIDFFGPLRDWVARWMPVFFVPSLISLPLATASISAGEVVSIVQVIIAGWSMSLLLATLTLTATRSAAHAELTPQEGAAYHRAASSDDHNSSCEQAKHASMQAKDTAPKPVSPFTPSHYLTWAFISMAALGASAALPQCTGALRSVFLLASTCKGYLLGVALPPPLKLVLHPILTCALYTTACCHLWASVSGSTYTAVLSHYMARDALVPGAGALLMAMLVVVVLCDGMRVYLQRSVVRRHGAEIIGTAAIASLFSMFATAKFAALAGLGGEIARSLVPRSVTAPLALPMSDTLGGILPLTAASVCFTGLLGAAFGQVLMSRMGLRDEISRGVAQASSAHGLGASALAATESQALPFSAVTIAAMGTISNVLLCVPVLRGALLGITG